jgi:hypothetical protein
VLSCVAPDCYDVTDTCPSADACIVTSTGARCARTKADCPAIADAYAAYVAAVDITPVLPGPSGLRPGIYNPGCLPIDCGVIPGHCDVGLGACFYLGRPQPELDKLAALYHSLGCDKPTQCQCPSQQVHATCETNPDGGSWSLSPGFTSTNACVVQ